MIGTGSKLTEMVGFNLQANMKGFAAGTDLAEDDLVYLEGLGADMAGLVLLFSVFV